MIRLEIADEAGGSCLNCARRVTERFSAAYGDEHDRVHRCLSCDCFRRVSKGSAATAVSVAGASDGPIPG